MTVSESDVRAHAELISEKSDLETEVAEEAVEWFFEKVPGGWGDNLKYNHVLAMALVYLSHDDLTQSDVCFGLTRTDDISRYVGHIRKAVGDVTVDGRFGTNYA